MDLNALVKDDFERALAQDRSKLIDLEPSLLSTDNTTDNDETEEAR